MKRLDLTLLETFRTVVEHGGFTAAADRLGLTQPGVSLQVRQLERQLGVRLIERIGRKAQPTRAGLEFLAHIPQIEASVDAAVDAVSRYSNGKAGRVRLGTGATACIFLLPPILGNLRHLYPDLEIAISTGNTADIVKKIQDNQLDLGLVTLPTAGRILDITPLLDDEFMLIAPPDTALPERVTAVALTNLPMLLFEQGGNTRHIADDWFAQAGVNLKPVMSLGSVEAIKELVAAGLGCAILPGMALRSHGEGSSFSVRSLSPRLHRKLALVLRRDKRLDFGLRETVRALEALAIR